MEDYFMDWVRVGAISEKAYALSQELEKCKDLYEAFAKSGGNSLISGLLAKHLRKKWWEAHRVAWETINREFPATIRKQVQVRGEDLYIMSGVEED
jgi:hypothetical protein